ncbi:MAG: tetratricopeptide repeat protein [Elusimicrobiota bacterium]
MKRKRAADHPKKSGPLSGIAASLRETVASLKERSGHIDSYKTPLYLLAVFALSLAVRLLYLGHIEALPYFDDPVIDPQQYDALARALFTSEDSYRFSAFYQAPGYAYLLAVIYNIFDSSRYWAHMVQMAMGAMHAVVVYLLGRRFFSHRVGLLASLFIALYGPMIFYEGDFYREPALALAMSAFVLLLHLAAAVPSAVRWFWAGLLLALSILTRESMLIYAPLAVYLLARAGLRRPALLRCLASLLLPLAVLLSYVSYRNYVREGAFTFVSSQGGWNFYIGNHEGMDRLTAMFPGAEWETASKKPLLEAGLARSYEGSRWFYGRAFRFIAEHPWRWVKLVFKKTVIFFGGYEFMPNEDVGLHRGGSWILRVLMFRWGPFSFPFGLICPLAILGWYGALKTNRRAALWLGGTVIVYALTIIAFHVRARYRIPVTPLFCVLAAAGLRDWAGPALEWRPKAFALKGLVLLGLIFVINFPLYDFSYAERFPSDYYAAKHHHKMKRHDRALEKYRSAVLQEPCQAEAYHDMGILLGETGRLDLGVAAVKSARDLLPDSHQIRATLGDMHKQAGRRDLAELEFRRSVELNPYDPKSRLELGRLVEEKDPKSAEREFRRVIELGKMFPGTDVEVLKEAKEGLWRVAKEDLSDDDVIPRRTKEAYLRVQKDRFKEIAKGADLSTREGRIKASDAYTNVGVAHLRLDELELAEEALLESLKISFNQTPAHINLGMVYRKMGNHDKALYHYQMALKILPGNYVALNNVGRLYEERKDYEKAYEYYGKASAEAPENTVIRRNMSRVRRLMDGGQGR